MEKKTKISLERFIYVLRRRFVWIIIIALLAGVAAGLLTKALVTPKYVSYATFYVQASDRQTQSITQQEITAAKSLVDTYIVFIKGNDFLDKVIKRASENHPELNIKYTFADVRKNMSASSESKTEVFKVSISDKDPKVAFALMEALTEEDMAPKMITDTSGGIMTVIDMPKLPTASNSTGAKRNAVFGAAIGAVLSFVVFFLTDLFDVTIYSEEDITENFTYPIIGTIPSIVPPSASQEKQKKVLKQPEPRKPGGSVFDDDDDVEGVFIGEEESD